MTETRLGDTWASREYPVLREACRLLELDKNFVGANRYDIADATGHTPEEVLRSLYALEAGGLVELHRMQVTRVSGEARRIVGQWPTPETGLDRMIAALEAIAENTDEDEDTRSRARKILDALAGAGRQVGIGVTTAIVTGQIPGS